MRPTTAAASMLMAVASAACVAHPVGPARTLGAYEGKATTTASSALSSVQTAALAVDSEGQAFTGYLGVVLSEQEDDLRSVADTFDSIQPPDERGDRLQHELDDILAAAIDDLTQLRVTVRRGERLPTDTLGDDTEALEAFLRDHGAAEQAG